MNKWIATEEHPVYLYYCKANIETGTTVIVLHKGNKHACKGVTFKNLCGEFSHLNSIGKAKASGTKNVLVITCGEIEEI